MNVDIEVYMSTHIVICKWSKSTIISLEVIRNRKINVCNFDDSQCSTIDSDKGLSPGIVEHPGKGNGKSPIGRDR